jgi:hypothetical protein
MSEEIVLPGEETEKEDSNDNEDDEEESPKRRKSKAKKTDFMQMTGNILTNMSVKMAFILFFMGMIIFSDLFIDSVLNKFDNTVHGECTTTKGTVLQLLMLVFGYIVMDLVVKYGWL